MSLGRIIWIITNLLILIIVSIWYYKTRDYESLAAVVGAAGGIVIFFLTKHSTEDSKPSKQVIKSGRNSTNIQSGRDTKIGK